MEDNYDFDVDGIADEWELEHFSTIFICVPGGNPDGDELNTFAEYAVGGDPTLDDATAYLPTYGVTDAGGGSNFVDYVYNRRLDAIARGLTYGLNTGTNLLGAWDYVGTNHETGSATINLDFESVTNAVPFAGEAGFVQLEVSSD